MNPDPVGGPGPPRSKPEFVVSSDIQSKLNALTDRGWAVEWERDDLVTCHLILFSSRRVQGSGTDATAAARAAISKLDAI